MNNSLRFAFLLAFLTSFAWPHAVWSKSDSSSHMPDIPASEQAQGPTAQSQFSLTNVLYASGKSLGESLLRDVPVYHPSSRVMVIADGAQEQLDRSHRKFFAGQSEGEPLRLSLDARTGAVSGYVQRNGLAFDVSGQQSDAALSAALYPLESAANACGNVDLDQPGGKLVTDAYPSMRNWSKAGMAKGLDPDYTMIIAVDTDSHWLDNKFNNNTSAAMDWIEDMILTMNVMFERDLGVRLLLGDVYLRVGTDPYTDLTTSNRASQLYEFSEYWRVTYPNVDRVFAMLLTGDNINANSFSGIAWLDAYCEYGRANGGNTYGGYSINAIGVNRSVANTARFVGHELGHNMGSPHTHCYAPEVDQCYNRENGCYSGAEVCPVAGSGTVMSYCHLSGTNCGNTVRAELNATVVGKISSEIANDLVQNNGQCVVPFTAPPPEGLIYADSFE